MPTSDIVPAPRPELALDVHPWLGFICRFLAVIADVRGVEDIALHPSVSVNLDISINRISFSARVRIVWTLREVLRRVGDP